MKFKNFLPVMLLMALTLTASWSFAQSDTIKTVTTKYQQAVQDQNQQKEDLAKVEFLRNQDRQKDADTLEKEYKAKAKETSRINDEASNAAKQAKKSAKMEKRAQKMRAKAEKQSDKAEKAAKKSDKNTP